MQIALKLLSDFQTKTLSNLATETSRLSIAGIGPSYEAVATKIHVVADEHREIPSSSTDVVEDIVNKVVQKLKLSEVNVPGPNTEDVKFVNQGVSNYKTSNRGKRYRGRYRGGYRESSSTNNNTPMKCRSCQGTGHLFRNCPVRFCQACGNRGHDAWNNTCPNYK